MTTFAVNMKHTAESCPMFNAEVKKRLREMLGKKEEAWDRAKKHGVQVLSAWTSVLDHLVFYIVEASSRAREKGGYATSDPIFSEPNRRLKEIWSQVEDAVKANRAKLEEDIAEETKITNNRFIGLIIAGAVSIVAVFVVLNPSILQIPAVYTGYATEILSVIIFAVIGLEIMGARSKHIVNVRALRGKSDREAKAEIAEYEKEATRQTQVMFDLAIKGES